MRCCLLLTLLLSAALVAQTPPDRVLTGTVSGSQNKTYIEVPFQVPAGTHRISVDFSYTGREQKTTLDLGIADPQRFRGNSGGNKSHFTIGESDATPSYLPGPIPAGRWKLLLSVPNIRPAVTTNFRAEVRFNSAVEDASFTTAPLATGKRWYRGDLHMHTAHSDGSCASQSGRRVPCPVFFTAQTATERGLDFIAITDHNATSHYEAMRELQPYFDRLLLIPGREMTTFWGHFNIFGTTQYVDYRVVKSGRDVNSVLRDAREHGAIASINHADSPTGEVCMGCGWTPTSPVDLSLLTGVEVINTNRPLVSADFWDKQLATGAHLTAIGGSDSHDALAPDGIAHPTTVVEASELSVPAILDGIRRGRVFIDLTASRDRVLDIDARVTSADSSSPRTLMGEQLTSSAGASIEFRVHLEYSPGSTVHLFLDGREDSALAPIAAKGDSETLPFTWKSDGERHWIRAEVRGPDGKLLLISNPIYIAPATH